MAESLEPQLSVALEKKAATELADPRGVRAQPPEDRVPLQRNAAATVAGGLPAVVSSMRHALGEAGVVRGTRLLLKLNQVDGFDCPGCAWPEPGAAPHLPSSARTARRRSPRRRPARASRRSSSPRHTVAELPTQQRLLAGPAGPPHPAAWCCAEGARPLRADRLGRRLRADRRASCNALGSPRRGRLLHLGPHQQRGRVPLPAVRARVRHQQPARLLEHVPRVERRRPDRDHRHRQGHASCSTTSTKARRDHRGRPEPGHQPPAHALRAAGGQARRRADRQRSTRCPRRASSASSTRSTRSSCCKGAALADLFLQVRIGGDVGALPGPAEQAHPARPRRRRRGVHRASTRRRLRGVRLRRARAAELGRDRCSASGIAARQIDEAAAPGPRTPSASSSAGRWA